MKFMTLFAVALAGSVSWGVAAEIVLNNGFEARTAKYHDHPDIFLGVEAAGWEKLFARGRRLTFDEREFENQTAVDRVSDAGRTQTVGFEGFTLSTAPAYLLSVPRSLGAPGKNGEITGRILFREPVAAAGVGICFATGSLRIQFVGEEGDVLKEYVVHGQPDPEKNNTWQDYFAVFQSTDEFSRVREITFARLNLNKGTTDHFAIDNLCWNPAPVIPPVKLPPVVAADYSLLNGANRVNVAPQVPAGKPSIALKDGVAVLENQLDGTRYTYRFEPKAGLSGITASLNGAPALPITLRMAPELGGRAAAEELVAVRQENDAVIAEYIWKNDRFTLPVTVRLYLSGGSLCFDFSSEKKNVPLRILKPRPEHMRLITNGDNTKFRYNDNIAFFGFGGDLGYLEAPGWFFSYQADWTKTNSTSPAPTITYQSTLDGKTVAPLRDTVAITVADTLPKVLPSIPNPVSPYREELASRVVMEYWYGHFDELGDLLDTYHRYGMDQLVILVHRWQNAGFDRKLPTIMPPSTARGGLDTLKAVIDRAKENGMRIALHDNYKDFYPTSPQWNPDDLMLCSNGKPQRAWADSCEMAPSKILKYAEPNMAEIREKLGPNAGYLDVHSAHLPWWRIDFRAGVPKAGMTAGTLEPNNALWQLARDSYQGPVFGESSPLTSWVHSGRIDAVMAATKHDNSFLVDFQLLKIRPLATNHGAGYFERWNKRGYANDWELAPLLPAEYARYSLNELSFLSSPTIDDKMKRQFLPAAVQYYQKRKIVERLVNQPVKAIWYYTPDNRKLTSSQAVFLPKIQIQRLQLEFADASAIWLNFGKTPWKVDDKLTVAPLGFYAKGKDFEAETGCRDGLWFDYWQGENGCFLNSRNYDWTLEPLGSTYHGRGEGKSPEFHNDGKAVSRGFLRTDTAVSLELEKAGVWRLRFFPHGQAGFVEIRENPMTGRIVRAIALDADGKEYTGNSCDELIHENDSIRIIHRTPGIWSYKLVTE